jgi:hypothetical protein
VNKQTNTLNLRSAAKAVIREKFTAVKCVDEQRRKILNEYSHTSEY